MKMDLQSILTFGKYKGKTVAEVMDENPRYLVWAHENVTFFRLPSEIASLAFRRSKDRILSKAALTPFKMAQLIYAGPKGEYAEMAIEQSLMEEDFGGGDFDY